MLKVFFFSSLNYTCYSSPKRYSYLKDPSSNDKFHNPFDKNVCSNCAEVSSNLTFVFLRISVEICCFHLESFIFLLDFMAGATATAKQNKRIRGLGITIPTNERTLWIVPWIVGRFL